jgi:hypothetical protein
MKPLLLLLIFAVNSPAQSIADAARKERARQKQTQSTVLYTNGTATILAPTSSSPAASTKAPAKKEEIAPAPPKPVGPTDHQGRDEQYWRGLFQKARDNAKNAEQKAQILDLKLNDLNTQYLRQSDIYNRENRLGPEITATQKDLDAARAEAEQANQKILDLEQDLRRAGGLPGWAR